MPRTDHELQQWLIYRVPGTAQAFKTCADELQPLHSSSEGKHV